MSFIDVRIELEGDEFEETVLYTPVSATVVRTDIPVESLSSVAEAAGQSEKWQVGVANAVLACLDGEETVEVSDFY